MAKSKPKPKPQYLDDDDDDQPKARVSVLNMILCLLNVVAAGGFVYILLMDLEKRQAWSYSIFLHDIAIMGLPLEEEEKGGLSASRDVRPKVSLRNEQLSAANKGRGGSVREPYGAVDEQLPARIQPSHLNEENQKDIFGPDLRPFVRTLEEEVKLVAGKVFEDIVKAADDAKAGAKTEAAKRQLLSRVLLSVASDGFQVRSLEGRARTVKAADLDKEIVDAVKRRLMLDMLQPIEMNRPGDSTKSYLENAGDLKKVPLDKLESELKTRLENAAKDKYEGSVFQGKDWDQKERDTIEKRQNIAYLLFAIGHVKKPDGTLLYPKGPERVQVVVGTYEFSRAAQAYTIALRELEKRVLNAILREREGAQFVADGEIQRTPGFVSRHQIVLQRLKDVVGEIDQAQKRVQDLEDQKRKAQKNLEDRTEHLKEISTRLVQERAKTAKLIYDMQLVQGSLFRAQVELADAAETNFLLEKKLRDAETLKPGGQAP